MAKGKDDDLGRMFALLKRIDSNKRYAELLEASAHANRMIKSEPDIGRRSQLDQFVRKCDQKMSFWRNRPDWDISEVARLRKQFAR